MRAALLIGLGLVVAVATTGRTASPRVIHVTARRFEYDPSEIHVRADEDVVLELESLDRTHGFSIPSLHLRTDIEAGKTVRVELPKAAPGTYVFGCDVFCGSHHEEMAGELVVE